MLPLKFRSIEERVELQGKHAGALNRGNETIVEYFQTESGKITVAFGSFIPRSIVISKISSGKRSLQRDEPPGMSRVIERSETKDDTAVDRESLERSGEHAMYSASLRNISLIHISLHRLHLARSDSQVCT